MNSLLGLITFGKYVFVHELGFEECPKFAFKEFKRNTSQLF